MGSNSEKLEKAEEKLDEICKINSTYQVVINFIDLFENYLSNDYNKVIPLKDDPLEKKNSNDVVFKSRYRYDLTKKVEKELKDLFDYCPILVKSKNGNYVLQQEIRDCEAVGIRLEKLPELTENGLSEKVRERGFCLTLSESNFPL